MEMMAPQGPVYQAGTLSANPIGMVAGLATLKQIKALKVHEILNKRTKNWVDQLRNAFQEKKIPVGIVQEYSLFWFYPTQENTSQPKSVEEFSPHLVAFYKVFFHELLDNGIYIAPSAYEVGFLSFAHTDELLNSLIPVFVEAARKGIASLK
jgi:glutamate-1-semialdehyde 2,1-aminomutase